MEYTDIQLEMTAAGNIIFIKFSGMNDVKIDPVQLLQVNRYNV